MLFYLLKKGDALLSYAERGKNWQLCWNSVTEWAREKAYKVKATLSVFPRMARGRERKKDLRPIEFSERNEVKS